VAAPVRGFPRRNPAGSQLAAPGPGPKFILRGGNSQAPDPPPGALSCAKDPVTSFRPKDFVAFCPFWVPDSSPWPRAWPAASRSPTCRQGLSLPTSAAPPRLGNPRRPKFPAHHSQTPFQPGAPPGERSRCRWCGLPIQTRSKQQAAKDAGVRPVVVLRGTKPGRPTDALPRGVLARQQETGRRRSAPAGVETGFPSWQACGACPAYAISFGPSG